MWIFTDSDRQTEMLIEAVRQEEMLWNKKSSAYSVRRSEKERAWARVAGVVGISGEYEHVPVTLLM